MDELVFAVPTVELWNILTYKETGFIPGNRDMLQRIVQKGLFRKRNVLEEDPSFKQIIPYGIISSAEEEQIRDQRSHTFLLFRRTSKQTEKRLHNKLTLGVGGHMNPAKSMEHKEQYLIGELKRELFEEVKLDKACFIEEIEFIGFINDDNIPVGRFHIGLLYNIRVSNKGVHINETDKLTAEWIERHDLVEYYDRMETWSKIAFDYYIR